MAGWAASPLQSVNFFLWSIIALFQHLLSFFKIFVDQVDYLEQFGTDCSLILWMHATQDIEPNINASPFLKTYFKFISQRILQSESMWFLVTFRSIVPPNPCVLDMLVTIPCEHRTDDERTWGHAVLAPSFTPEHWLRDSEMQFPVGAIDDLVWLGGRTYPRISLR